jgi:hypothetical protein
MPRVSKGRRCFLAGQKRLLLIGLITSISEKAIEAIPFVIANPISDLGRPKTLIGRHWYNRLEVFADSIDTFEAIRKIPALRDKHLIEVLRSIPTGKGGVRGDNRGTGRSERLGRRAF